jgi:hypothetical protein
VTAILENNIDRGPWCNLLQKVIFRDHGHKIIWFHGLSEAVLPVLGTITYYEEMTGRSGGLKRAQQFSRFYLIPNMGPCGGGPATEQFDHVTQLTNSLKMTPLQGR